MVNLFMAYLAYCYAISNLQADGPVGAPCLNMMGYELSVLVATLLARPTISLEYRRPPVGIAPSLTLLLIGGDMADASFPVIMIRSRYLSPHAPMPHRTFLATE